MGISNITTQHIGGGNMTLLASWIGIDTHGPTSAYMVSDSRISWGMTRNFDYGKKVFASSQYPEIFGYAGEVIFPSIVLAQLIEMIDAGILFTSEMTCSEKHAAVFEKLCHSFSKYPEDCVPHPVQILHISRDTNFEKYPAFSCRLFTWSAKSGWHCKTIEIPNESGILCVLGSGAKEFNPNYERYRTGANSGTSRNVFHCFIDTLFNTTDPACGGPPQLVGIYRKPGTNATNFGIIYNKKRYLLGMELPDGVTYDKIEWRNELFEIADGLTKKKAPSATSQPDPFRRK